ncbi:MAG: tetratricopeptide repeat-containing protein [Planctomycetota bacterium]|nr:MAG: tetratricopeptide repeat-containing protein [Planctomycetota bacterium]
MWRCFVTDGLRERLAFAVCLWLVSCSGLPSLRAQTSSVVSGSAPTERLLLLQNGKVVKGVIRQSAAGYVVNVTGGQLVLPFDQVRLEAADLEDVYRQQRDTLPDHTAAAHIELARWCHSNGLPDQARKELREALRREPDSTVAKNMLQRINDQLLTTKDVPAVTQRSGQFSMLGDAKPGIASETLGGLPREAAADFVSKVQPLLVNRCATAGCHGPGSRNSFELLRAKLGKAPPKVYSERNLAAVLERLDLERPLSSPLLVKVRGETKSLGTRQAHGGLTPEQQQTLRAWIESISKKPEPVAKPKAEIVAEDSDSKSEDSTSDVPAKIARNRPDRLSDDEFLADENLFRKLLRELRDDTSKSDEINRSTNDE